MKGSWLSSSSQRAPEIGLAHGWHPLNAGLKQREQSKLARRDPLWGMAGQGRRCVVLPLPEGGGSLPPTPFPRGPREGTAHTFGRKCPYHCGQQGADGRAGCPGHLDKRFFTLKICSTSASTERIWADPQSCYLCCNVPSTPTNPTLVLVALTQACSQNQFYNKPRRKLQNYQSPDEYDRTAPAADCY